MKNNQSKEKVLIVDDEMEICFLLSSILKSKGYETATAGNLKDALIEVENFEPQYVILDVNLPDGEGFDIVPELKERDVKIIVITARDGNNEVLRAKELEVDEFVRKPFNAEYILSTLDKIAHV